MSVPGPRRSPPTRRRFRDSLDERRYLEDKIRYWTYVGNRSNAAPFMARLTRLAPHLPPKSLPKAECWAFIAEWHGDWANVVKYRREEIKLVELLRRLAKTENPLARRAILRNFPTSVLARLYERLA